GLQSVASFVGAAPRPIRRGLALLRELGLPMAIATAFVLLGVTVGWLAATVVVLAMLAALLALEGARREHQHRVFAIDVKVGAPEDLGYNKWKLFVVVRNKGATGTFTTRCVNYVSGLDRTDYGHFDL